MKRFISVTTLLVVATTTQAALANCDKAQLDIDASHHYTLETLVLANHKLVSRDIGNDINNSLWLQTATFLDSTQVSDIKLIAASQQKEE